MSVFFSALERAEQDLARRRRTALSEPASDGSPALPAESQRGLEQLKILVEYTKFDIALYTTVGTIFAAAIAFEPSIFKIHKGLLSLALIFVCLAGIAAGIIASRCADFTSWNELRTAKIGPFSWRCLKGRDWAYVQHACFVIALIAALIAVFDRYAK
jgi:hypothetical protein